MSRPSAILAAFLALGIALSPVIADARAGGGSSWGSRGSRTWSPPPTTNTAPYSAQPMERSVVPNAPAPSYAGAPYGAPGMRPRSAFTSGLFGGLIGAGLGGLLLGHGFFGGISGFGSFFGFLIQILLIVFVVRWLLRRFTGGGAQPSFAGLSNVFARNGGPQPGQPGRGQVFGSAAPAARPVAITPADYQAFEQILKNVQAAWSAGDLNVLRSLATPEMVSYFAEQLADASSRGVRNTVTDVRLQKGDLSEAWSENGREFATVAMQFSMIDTTRDASGRIVDGSATDHVTATELWTFMRTAGGRWVLSAIQQTR
jgi:predicted lipid-binding transport protein (Tim44 family)